MSTTFFLNIYSTKKTSPKYSKGCSMWTDGRKDMTNLTVALRNFAKALKSGIAKVSRNSFSFFSKQNIKNS